MVPISICIPTYNTDVTFLVKSLYEQCERNSVTYEILIVDDASTSQEVRLKNQELTKLNHVRILLNSTNLGRIGSRIKAANEALYDWILFLDADVIPVTSNFIKNYYKSLSSTYHVILGGISYRRDIPHLSQRFRWYYGIEREEASAAVRNAKPYAYVLSGNILIDKKVFLKFSNENLSKLYGMDIYLSYQLYMNSLPVLHIDNSVYHDGLESNESFFNKALLSVESRFAYLKHLPGIENVNPLIKYYNLLSRFRLRAFTAFLFKIFRKPMEKQIICDSPNLFLFDIYRLGYMCTLK